MDREEIIKDFDDFFQLHGNKSFEKLGEFFQQEAQKFYRNHSYANDIQARQGWVTIIGSVLEAIVERILKDFCAKYALAMTSDRELLNPKTPALEQVRRNVEVFFGEYSLLPDADIIIYCPNNYKVIAIISVKNSFRERYTETPYWKIKLSERESTRDIRVFMVTPDRDNEISFNNTPRKARIVLEYELDGIYLAKQEFDKTDKVKSISELVYDLTEIIRGNPCN